MPILTDCLHFERSAAVVSHVSTSMLADRRSRLQASLNLRHGRPRALVPFSSWPYRRSFGILCAPIRLTWPSQRKRRSLSIANTVQAFALLRISVVVTLSLQDTPRILRRHLRWKAFSLDFCLV